MVYMSGLIMTLHPRQDNRLISSLFPVNTLYQMVSNGTQSRL